jgi:hypothetical protein
MVVLGWGADALGVVLGMAGMQATAWPTSVADLGFLVGLIGLLPGLPGGGAFGGFAGLAAGGEPGGIAHGFHHRYDAKQ